MLHDSAARGWTPEKEISAAVKDILEKEILIPEKTILDKVEELAHQISSDYEGKEPILVGILNGVVFFFADLVKKMTVPTKIDFIRAASYGSGTSSSGDIKFTKDVEIPVQDKPVIVVEDIVDTGLTLRQIVRRLEGKGPESIRICALIDKLERREEVVTIDYCGFQVKEGFLVGYGLDHDEQYRYLRDIYVLRWESRLNPSRRVTMIIECEGCESKFNLDEGLLKAGGSKVRCSICKNVFIAYPPEELRIDEPATDMILEEGLAETLSLETPPDAGEEETEALKQAGESDFDLAFEEAVEEADVHEAVSPDEIPDIEEEEVAEAETADLAREEGEGGLEPAAAPVAKPKTRRSRALPILVLILLLILGGAAAVFYFAPDIIPDSIPFLQPSKQHEAVDPGVARLSFRAVSGSFIQSHKAGQLFVIKGRVTNNYPKPRSFILIKGTILDDKGKVVKINMAYAGNTFAEKQIKEKPIEELNNGLKIRMGRNRMNLNLQSGATIPFMIILDKLPENVSEFTVEAVSSSPGK